MVSFLGAASTVDLGPAIQQIGIGALVAVPAYWWGWLLWKDNRILRRECNQAFDAQITRERELSDRMGPLLANAADVLARTPERFDKALAEARNSSQQDEVDRKLQRLERMVERIVEVAPRERGGSGA